LLQAFFIETCQVIGIALLALFILPELDVVKGAMLMNAMCIVPGILNALTRDRNHKNYYMTLSFDVLSISAQATAFVVWPLLDGGGVLWTIPLACVFISLGWWENFLGNSDKEPSGVYLLNIFYSY
jgi:chitin synthase